MKTHLDVIEDLKNIDGPLLPILHGVQELEGFISEAAILAIADKLNLTRAEVWGVVSFYHDFRTEPCKGPVLKVCRAEACKARGVEQLMPSAEKTANAAGVQLEAIYCLGLCSAGPAAMTSKGDVHARLDAEKFADLIGSVK
jgi:formate dehydrogenase subunit gamma